MRLGSGIFLLVVGAILAFAVRDSIEAVDLTMVGYICMVAGALAVLLALIMQRQRANTSHHEVVDRRESGSRPPTEPPA